MYQFEMFRTGGDDRLNLVKAICYKFAARTYLYMQLVLSVVFVKPCK